jgi:hypothetical protein
MNSFRSEFILFVIFFKIQGVTDIKGSINESNVQSFYNYYQNFLAAYLGFASCSQPIIIIQIILLI